MRNGRHQLVLGVFHTLGKLRRRFWLNLNESTISLTILHIVWVVAFGAGEPALFARAGPFANALAVYAIAPITKLVAVAFAA